MKQNKSTSTIKRLTAISTLVVMSMTVTSMESVLACTRILYETGYGTYITGRGMDWNDPTAKTALWVFPRGMERDGGVGKNPVKWISEYGSVGTSFYDAGTADGMNEKGLVGNLLYLAESDYGDPAMTEEPTLSVGAWLQYFLDNYASVKSAVEAMKDAPFRVLAPMLPNGRAASMHLSLSDSTGDSAIFEYIDGKLVVHHGPEYEVMTNSPVYDQQLVLNAYWTQIGGDKFLPGTISAADRFVRASYHLESSPKYKDSKLALASVFSQMRSIGVPVGMSDPDHPNISMTLWRTVADHGAKVYYFESVIIPAVFWVDLNKIDFKKGAGPRTIAIEPEKAFAGDVSERFEPAEPFKWLTTE